MVLLAAYGLAVYGLAVPALAQNEDGAITTLTLTSDTPGDPRGDRPQADPSYRDSYRVPPHKWAVGTTFEWEFDFPITTNPAYEAKPAPKRKTTTSANPKAVSSRDRKTPKPATVQTASRKHPRSQRESA